MAYNNSRTITIDYTKVGAGGVANFPVLIAGTYSYLATVANGGEVENANGYDIIFTSDAAGETALYHEIEYYNATTGQIAFWVKVPSISAVANTVIYIWYGNSSISTFQSTASSVWDANYLGVWHMPDGTTLTCNDSTSNDHDGSAVGSPSAVAGKIDGGGSFSGTGQYYTLPDLGLSGATARTLSMWAKRNTTAFKTIFWIQADVPGALKQFVLHCNVNATGDLYIGFNDNDYWTAGSKLSDSALTHVVVVYTGGTLNTDTVFIYVDNVSQSLSKWQGSPGAANTVNENHAIAWDGTNAFNGVLDEVRISNIARTAAWITTEFNNQNSPSTFYAVGDAVVRGPANLKTIQGLIRANIKSVQGLAMSSIKTFQGLS